MQEVPLGEIAAFRSALLAYAEEQAGELCRRIDRTGQLSDSDRAEILALSHRFLEQYRAAHAR